MCARILRTGMAVNSRGGLICFLAIYSRLPMYVASDRRKSLASPQNTCFARAHILFSLVCIHFEAKNQHSIDLRANTSESSEVNMMRLRIEVW